MQASYKIRFEVPAYGHFIIKGHERLKFVVRMFQHIGAADPVWRDALNVLETQADPVWAMADEGYLVIFDENGAHFADPSNLDDAMSISLEDMRQVFRAYRDVREHDSERAQPKPIVVSVALTAR